MSSNLKVNTILPSTGSDIGIGTNGGELNVDGGCKVQVGTALTLGHSTGVQFSTQNLHSTGFEVNQINASGIVTASHFYGNGANLTGITGTTINNNANNRLITGSGTANTLEGESNLTYDGTTLTNGAGGLALQSAGGDLINVTSTTASSRTTIKFNTNGNDWEIGARGSSGNPNNSFYFYDSATTSYRLLIASNGDFGFNDTSPTAHSSGNNTVLSIKGKGSSYSGKIDFKDSDGNLDSYINSDNSVFQLYCDPNSQNGNTAMIFYVHGGERFRFGRHGQLGIAGANYGTAGQVLKSGGASAAATWGSASSGGVETYALAVFGSVYDTNSGYILHNITAGYSNNITVDTSNEKLTPTVSGTYLIIYNAHWLGLHSSGTTYYNRITKNGSEIMGSNFSAYDAGSHMHTVLTTTSMNGSSDYIQFEFYENKSGAAAYVSHKSRAIMILLDT